MLSVQDAIAAGGEEGKILFNATSGAFTLYSNETDILNSAGGQFVPDVHVSGSIPWSNVTVSKITEESMGLSLIGHQLPNSP